MSTALTRDVLLNAGYSIDDIKKMDNTQRLIRNLDKGNQIFLNQMEHKVPKSVATE